MTSIVLGSAHARTEHFEPEPALTPTEQRKLRGHLEQIDYAAFAANRTVLAQGLGKVGLARFEHLAVSAAHARARWVAAAIAMTEQSAHLAPDEVAHLGTLRRTFEELAEAYEAMRRMVERGYLTYQPGG